MSEVIGTAQKLAPVVLAFGVGVVFARRKVIGSESSKVFSEFAFRFAIPAYLLGKLYSSDLGHLFDPVAIAAYITTAVLAMTIVATVARFVSASSTRGTALRIMAACQVNTAYVAIPVFILLFGDAAPIFPVLLLQVCVLTVVVIAIMESAGAPDVPGQTVGVRIRRGVGAALTTPVVLACYGGIAANLANVPVPGWALDSLSFTGDAASPVALFALGLHLGGSGLRWRGASGDEYWLIGFKVAVFPLLALLVCRYVFAIQGPWLSYLVLIAAMPAPQNLFIFAQQYDVEPDLAASIVVKTSLAAMALLPLWAAIA
ncbi:AEC family transporter [Nocardia sp. XZ_19_369]|uniref:AEC family transporter n=1 Tax=Nocardia sp. XZ_19_369 TaxID=2769487 RepID=UPI00188F528A|nr:AEC family transporter [Nocardia sp. XZ_19_369]